MRHAMRLGIVLIGAVSAWGCAVTLQHPSAFGREVRVRTIAGLGVKDAEGELITADEEKLILLTKDGTLHEIPLAGVKHVSVRRHGFDGRKGLLWTALGAFVTGGALTASCSRVAEGCGGVFAVTVAVWGVVGGLSSAAIESSSRRKLPPGASLRQFARFPQGLPEGKDAASFLARPPILASPPLPGAKASDTPPSHRVQESAAAGGETAGGPAAAEPNPAEPR